VAKARRKTEGARQQAQAMLESALEAQRVWFERELGEEEEEKDRIRAKVEQMKASVDRLRVEAEENRRANLPLSRECASMLREARSGRAAAAALREAIDAERRRVAERVADLAAQEDDLRAFIDVQGRVKETEVEGASVVFTTGDSSPARGSGKKRQGRKKK